MKEMWTGIFPNRKDYNYEIRFRTDDKTAYKFVEEACRNAIDINWQDKESETIENKKANDKFRWLRIDNKVYDITTTPVIEIDCECNILTHLFDIQDMLDNWNTAGIFTCSECHRRITYELLK